MDFPSATSPLVYRSDGDRFYLYTLQNILLVSIVIIASNIVIITVITVIIIIIRCYS